MSTLTAELVATGDELMTGAISDTNSARAAEALRMHGVDVTRFTVVGDDPERMLAVLQEASQRARFVVCGGGLGPTEDDRTAECAARLAGVELAMSDDALAVTTRAFERIGREMTPNNRKQAMLPAGCEVLDNPIGTAAGFHVRANDCDLFFLPGVPREYERMLNEQVLPRIDEARGEVAEGALHYRLRVLKLFGQGESRLASEMGDLHLPASVMLGWRPRFPEIHLRLYAADTDVGALDGALDEAEQAIRERVGKYVFGRDDDELPAVVGQALVDRGWTMGAAESCTGGLLGSLITSVSGSSAWFERGFITYSNQSKTELLGVSESLLAEHGAVSEPVAEAMATGARERAGVDLALAITGVAGPTGGTDEKPVGTVFVALATAERTNVRHLKLWGTRKMIRELSAWSALEMARRELLGIGSK